MSWGTAPGEATTDRLREVLGLTPWTKPIEASVDEGHALAKLLHRNLSIAEEAAGSAKTPCKRLQDWKAPDFARYLGRMLGLAWAGRDLVFPDFGKSLGVMRRMLVQFKPEVVRLMIDNMVLNWPAVVQKYKIRDCNVPHAGILWGWREPFEQDTAAGGTVSPAHRVSALEQEWSW